MAGSLSRLTRSKHFRWLFTLVLTVLIFGVYLTVKPGPELPPLPVPNGYDDILRASHEVSGQPPSPGTPEGADIPKLKAILNANQEPLHKARLGLSRDCGVPLGTTRNDLEIHMNALGEIRKISRLLAAEATVAQSEGRLSDAGDAYLDLFRLGGKASAGGLMIDGSLGYAFESMGSMGLSGIRRKLPPDESRRVAQALLDIDQNRENPARAVARDRIWFNRTAGTWERFVLNATGAARRQLQPAIAQYQLSDHRSEVFMRLLIVDLALTAHQSRTGRYPASLDALAPGELSAVPVDPFSGHPLVYSVKEDAYVLYSIGPDGRDDHGTPLPDKARWDQAKGDVVLSPPSP